MMLMSAPVACTRGAKRDGAGERGGGRTEVPLNPLSPCRHRTNTCQRADELTRPAAMAWHVLTMMSRRERK